MFQKLSFQKKLFYAGSFFSLSIALLISAVFYVYTYKRTLLEIKKFYIQTNQTMMSDLDNLLTDMEKLTTQLVANRNIQNIFIEAGEYEDKEKLYFDYHPDKKSLMQTECIALNTPMENKSIINIYKSPNIFFTNSFGKESSEYIKEQLQTCYEFTNKKEQLGSVLFLGPHTDFWNLSEDGQLYISILRPLVSTYEGNNIIGTIEMDEEYEKIEDICSISDQFEEIMVVIVDTKNGDIIYPYTGVTEQEATYYLQYENVGSEELLNIDAFDGSRAVLNVQKSQCSDWAVYMIQSQDEYMRPVTSMSVLVISLFVFCVLGIILGVFYATNKLTMPIRELREAIKTVTLDDSDIHMDQYTNNEILELKKAFSDIISKLSISANNLALAQVSEYEAKIMTLQAQINPHFLYNSLMAISAAGAENGNRKVESMCAQLSSLFRYTVSDNIRVPLREEIRIADIYLKFMKLRYQSTVEYSIDVDEKILQVEVPRLILQPIIENCFTYAFHSIFPPLIIKVRGRVIDGRWIISVEDNGTGAKEEEIQQLLKLKDGVKDVILHKKAGDPIRIEGKALINIYARLYLKYGEDTIFTIDNVPGEFKIGIGGLIKEAE